MTRTTVKLDGGLILPGMPERLAGLTALKTSGATVPLMARPYCPQTALTKFTVRPNRQQLHA
jgi:hypothetical protein